MVYASNSLSEMVK